MSNLTKRHTLLTVVALLVVAGLVHAFWPAKKEKDKSASAVPVKVAVATVQDYPLRLVTVGRVLPSETVTLKARVDGQVTQVLMQEGRPVKAGEVLMRLDDGEFRARLAQAEAVLARDEAQLANARIELARNEALKEKNYVSDDMLRASRTNVASLAATTKGDRAAVENARLQLSYTVIRAPFDGRAGGKLVYPGTAVKTNDTTLAVINRLHPVQVAFAAPEKYLGQLQPLRNGGKLKLSVSSDSDSSLHVDGEANFLDNAVDTTTGTIQVKATFPNLDDRLTPGAFVKVSLDLQTLKDVVTVPSAAVQQNGDVSSVYVVGPDNKVALREVKIRESREGIAALDSGLAAGETVVTDGQLRLTPDAVVQVSSQGHAPDKTPGNTPPQEK